MFSLYGSIFSKAIRIILAYALNPIFDIRSIWLAQGMGWIAGYAFVMARFLSGHWKKKGVKFDDKFAEIEDSNIDIEDLKDFDKDKLKCRR